MTTDATFSSPAEWVQALVVEGEEMRRSTRARLESDLATHAADPMRPFVMFHDSNEPVTLLDMFGGRYLVVQSRERTSRNFDEDGRLVLADEPPFEVWDLAQALAEGHWHCPVATEIASSDEARRIAEGFAH